MCVGLRMSWDAVCMTTRALHHRCVSWTTAGLQARAEAASEEPPEGPSAGSASWGPGASLESLTLLAADLVRLQGAVAGEVAGAMLSAVQPLVPDVAASVQVRGCCAHDVHCCI